MSNNDKCVLQQCKNKRAIVKHLTLLIRPLLRGSVMTIPHGQ